MANLVYLPSDVDGSKVGLDDFFAQGHTIDALLGYATPHLRPLPAGESENEDSPYQVNERGTCYLKATTNGPVAVPLANFTAEIVADVSEDDGVESRRSFEIEARLHQQVLRFTIPGASFGSMGWISEYLGAGAILYPAFQGKEHLRVAIQLHSKNAVARTIYTHTGWRKIDGKWFYLHGQGAIGDGGRSDIQVQLPTGMTRFVFPEPPTGEVLVKAVRASLRLLELGPNVLMFALLSFIYRAPLGGVDFCLFLVGPSGVFKSELAGLAQSHFGSGYDARNLPGSWSSTPNFLEALSFHYKDALLTIDDFAPVGGQADVQRLHGKADQIIRGQGNRSGRGRMNANGTLRQTKSSRAALLLTGEDAPQGHSLRARTIISEVAPGDISPQSLTLCQQDGKAGYYVQAVSAYVNWMAGRHEKIQDELPRKTEELRARFSGQHRRTPDITANLAMGLQYFLQFTIETKAISMTEADQLWERGWAALIELGARQAAHQAASEPVLRFLELLGAALASKRAHLANASGDRPDQAEAYGWRKETNGGEERWVPGGARVGWIVQSDLYLDPGAAFAIAKRLGGEIGDGITIGSKTLNKRLHEQGLLLSAERDRSTYTVRKVLEGVSRRPVLHLHIRSLVGEKVEIDATDTSEIFAEK